MNRFFVIAAICLLTIGATACTGEDYTCRTLCGRNCEQLLAELEPGVRTHVHVMSSSTSAALIAEAVLERDPKAYELSTCLLYGPCFSTDRRGVEYLCSSEHVSSLLEDSTVYPHAE